MPLLLRCSSCGTDKPLPAFHRNKGKRLGVNTTCRDCVRTYGAAKYVAIKSDPQRRQAFTLRCRINSRTYIERHRTEVCERAKQRRKQDATATRERDAKSNATPQAHARRLLRNAIRRGEVMPPGYCEDCHGPGPLHGHHVDYDAPLDVVWLCRTCHGQRHRMPIGK